MDKLELYRNIVIEIIKENARIKPNKLPNVSVQVSFDKENDHYHLHYVGWDGLKRVYICLYHIDIIDEKIWLQVDNTDSEIASELVEKGIPKSDIVLGFQSPYKRQYTEFAVA